MGIRKFNPVEKPLQNAKSSIIQLIRDDGSIDWYEGAKAGQLFQIETGGEKAYINLDQAKIKNFISEIEDEEGLPEEHQDKKRIKELKEKEVKVKEIPVRRFGDPPLPPQDYQEKKIKVKDLYKKSVFLDGNKAKNLGTAKKPVMGFICYEKEFNALPNEVMHDSRQITSWLDFIVKNYKSFSAQKIEGIKTMMIIGFLGVAFILFVIFRYGSDFFAEQKAAEVAAEKAKDLAPVVIQSFATMNKRVRTWLKG